MRMCVYVPGARAETAPCPVPVSHTVRVRWTPTRGMALTWHEDAGDSMERDLALGEAISIVKKHKEQHGEPVDMTVRRKRGGKRAQNRMNQVVVLNLHSQGGTSSGTIALPR